MIATIAVGCHGIEHFVENVFERGQLLRRECCQRPLERRTPCIALVLSIVCNMSSVAASANAAVRFVNLKCVDLLIGLTATANLFEWNK